MKSPHKSHPVYAALYDRLNLKSEQTWLGEIRRLALQHARGRVLEIGSGTGQTFQYYRDVDRVVACEPDPAFRKRLATRMREAHVPIELMDAVAEDLPFANDSFDTVVSSLVMCSVRDPKRAAAELRRVVRPDGILLIIEHVRTDEGGVRAFAQNAIVPLWKLFVGGCHCNRPSVETLASAGFRITELRRFNPPGVPSITFPSVTALGYPV